MPAPPRTEPPTQPLTARQQKARDTRSRLFTAAAELFDQQGYHGTTVDQIARRAKVAKGTFFLHFATKDAVVTELVRLQMRGARKARDGLEGADALQRLRATVLGLGQMAGVSRSLSRAVIAATVENPALGGEADALFHALTDEMALDARRAQADGLLRAELAPETVAQVLMASYMGAAMHFVTSRTPHPLLDLLAALVDANLAAFRRG